MFDAILSGGPGGEAPGKAGGFGGPRGPPMRGMVGGKGTVKFFRGDDTISVAGQGWVDVIPSLPVEKIHLRRYLGIQNVWRGAKISDHQID